LSVIGRQSYRRASTASLPVCRLVFKQTELAPLAQDGQGRGGLPLADSRLIVMGRADFATVRFVDETENARLPAVAEMASRFLGAGHLSNRKSQIRNHKCSVLLFLFPISNRVRRDSARARWPIQQSFVLICSMFPVLCYVVFRSARRTLCARALDSHSLEFRAKQAINADRVFKRQFPLAHSSAPQCLSGERLRRAACVIAVSQSGQTP